MPKALPEPKLDFGPKHTNEIRLPAAPKPNGFKGVAMLRPKFGHGAQYSVFVLRSPRV